MQKKIKKGCQLATNVRPKFVFAQTSLVDRSLPILLAVHVPDVFLSFEFQKNQKKNVGAVGSKFLFSH